MNSSANGSKCWDDVWSSASSMEMVFLSLIDFLIVVGNSLVILAYIYGNRRMRTYTNYFVVNLAVSDLLVGLISLPFWICVRHGQYCNSADRIVRKIFQSVDIVQAGSTIMCLTGVSVERMVAVKYPIRHRNTESATLVCALVGVWAIGVVLALPIFFLAPGAPGDCTYSSLSEERYTIGLVVFAFLVPLAVILFCYIRIFQGAKELLAAIPDGCSDIKVAKTISIIIGLFLVCWTPVFLVNFLWIWQKTLRIPYIALYIVKALHYANSMMNFFVYAMRNADFREAFKAIIFKCDVSKLHDVRNRATTMILTRGSTLMHSVRMRSNTSMATSMESVVSENNNGEAHELVTRGSTDATDHVEMRKLIVANKLREEGNGFLSPV